MYTVEFESDAAVITSLDQKDKYEDVEMVVAEDNTVYIRQFDEQLNQYQMIYMSYQQLLDLSVLYVAQKVHFMHSYQRSNTMTQETNNDYTRLQKAVEKYSLSIEEGVRAIEMFANDKRFQEELDIVYNNKIVDDWDEWYPLDEM